MPYLSHLDCLLHLACLQALGDLDVLQSPKQQDSYDLDYQ